MGTGGSIYDGQQQVLYWADVSSEVAFVVPTLDNFHRLQNDGGRSLYWLKFKPTSAAMGAITVESITVPLCHFVHSERIYKKILKQ